MRTALQTLIRLLTRHLADSDPEDAHTTYWYRGQPVSRVEYESLGGR